jgi:hypothetical protein
MNNMYRRHGVVALAIAILAVGEQSVAARDDIRVEFDKTFAFKHVRTWAWSPEGAGQVKMARHKDDDPDAVKRQAEPWIVDAVEKEMTRLGLAQAPSGADVVVTYYLLLSTSFSAQTMGQFLPSVPEWGLPPFPPATQSLKFMNRGSLVLDLTANGTVVWRGLAQRQLQPDVNDQKREAAIRKAVRDLLRRYPR